MSSSSTPSATLPMTQTEKRLRKELMFLLKDPPPGISVDKESVMKNLSEWIVNLVGTEGSLYAGERYQLLFKFNNRYPFEPPEVTFTGGSAPVHPHVYSNGHICLSILYDDWSPALSVHTICLSISSMLTCCLQKQAPLDDAVYVTLGKRSPKETKWWYHDDKI